MPDPVLPTTARVLLARTARAQREGRAPSLVAGVVRNGELAWSAGRGEVPEPHTDVQYRLGSISKTVTAVAVMRLRDEGRLHLDDLLERHLPGTPLGTRPVRAAQRSNHSVASGGTDATRASSVVRTSQRRIRAASRATTTYATKIPPCIGPKIFTPSSVVPGTYLTNMPISRPIQEQASATATVRKTMAAVRGVTPSILPEPSAEVGAPAG